MREIGATKAGSPIDRRHRIRFDPNPLQPKLNENVVHELPRIARNHIRRRHGFLVEVRGVVLNLAFIRSRNSAKANRRAKS